MPEDVTTGEPELNPNVPAEVPTAARLTPPVAPGTSLKRAKVPVALDDVEVATVAGPEKRGLSPHSAVRTGLVQDGVGSARPLRHAAQVVPVQQVHAAVFADLGHQVRVRGGAIAVRDRDGSAGAQICVVPVQFRVVGRAEEVGGFQVAVTADPEPDHRLRQGGGGLRCPGRASGKCRSPW